MTRKDLVNQDKLTPAEPTAAEGDFVALVLQDPDQENDLPALVFHEARCVPVYATCLDDALDQLNRSAPDLIFMPLQLNGNDTLSFLAQCKAVPSAPNVIVTAKNDQINDAADAMHQGAFDCLFQPFNHTRLAQVIRDSLAHRPTRSGARAQFVQSTQTEPMPFPAQLPPASNMTKSPIASDEQPSSPAPTPTAKPQSDMTEVTLLGDHPSFRSAMQRLESVANSTAPVFLQGEVGTGKERCARAVHDLSGRPADRFVVVDCAALHPDTVASEIFGHDKGGSASSSRGKSGAAQRADGGTLYLDEIANLDPKVQRQLVRFLRSGQIRPLGAPQPRNTDIRIISASSHDPMALINSGELLKELYYQLHVATIHLPPLKDRGEDVTILADYFLSLYVKAEGAGFTGFTPDALAILRAHSWPGNVHELKNVIWNAVLQHDGNKVTRDMLPEGLGSAECQGSAPATTGLQRVDSFGGKSLAEIEQMVIEEAIRAHDGSVPKAARTLGVSPSTIYRKRENWQS
ncbi:sigma-54-dependent transcriptional regulator [Aliiroseovarius crassostreae]|uniref:sigma-54-dependent transcriptional regulator n=1 Tax=Aliiroseovarius crassostreae TaxID=154981 RepID=UPI003C7B4A5A